MAWAVVVVMRVVRSAACGGATGNDRIVAKNGPVRGVAPSAGADRFGRAGRHAAARSHGRGCRGAPSPCDVAARSRRPSARRPSAARLGRTRETPPADRLPRAVAPRQPAAGRIAAHHRGRSRIAAEGQERAMLAGTSMQAPLPHHRVFLHVKSTRVRLSLWLCGAPEGIKRARRSFSFTWGAARRGVRATPGPDRRAARRRK